MGRKDKVVVIGGGFGGLFTALELVDKADVTLISKDDQFTFTPMLYEYLSGEVEAWHVSPYYKDLIDNKMLFVRGEVTDVDFDNKKVVIEGWGKTFDYDSLVIAVGSTSNYYGIKGAAQYTIPFRKASHADELRRRMITALDAIPPETLPEEVRDKLTFAIVGGGASGVELATKMADMLRDAVKRRNLKGEARVIIFEMGERIVPGMGDELHKIVDESLNKEKVTVSTTTKVVEVKAHSIVHEHNGETVETQTAAVIWTAGIRVNALNEKLNVEKNDKNLIILEPTLQVKGRPEVFALGDNATLENIPSKLPGTAQLAFQESNFVANNVKAFLAGKKLKNGEFKELGETVSLGTENAAIGVGNFAYGGTLAREARFAIYTSRLPTWHHRLKVGADWFLGGTKPQPLQSGDFNL